MVQASKQQRQRIDLLDAYRTIAIAWVALYHYTFFWSSAGRGDAILPYDAALSWIPLADVGGLGVTLFFLISGFVIPLTLRTTPNFSQFAVKRFARLWPTLLICGIITFVVMKAMGPPELQRSVPEALISMTLIPPKHVGMVLGQESWMWLDGAYWSLWVEVRFYAVIGLIYYLFPKRWLEGWLVYELAAFAVALAFLLAPSGKIDILDGLMFGEHVPIFTLGILACRYRTNQTTRTDLLAVLLASAHILFNIFKPNVAHSATPTLLIGYAIVFALFAVFVWRPTILSWLEHKYMLKIGRASYSFYLLHQVVGISVLVFIASLLGTTASLIALPFVLAGIVYLSLQIFDRVEQPANRWIVAKYKSRFSALPAASS